MQAKRKSLGCSRGGLSPTGREDAAWQARILALLLSEYPQQFTQTELARELIGTDAVFAEQDAVTRAIDDLIRIGLLYRCDALILLTRAARHFDALELE
jgi:hypothetical protein